MIEKELFLSHLSLMQLTIQILTEMYFSCMNESLFILYS